MIEDCRLQQNVGKENQVKDGEQAEDTGRRPHHLIGAVTSLTPLNINWSRVDSSDLAHLKSPLIVCRERT